MILHIVNRLGVRLGHVVGEHRARFRGVAERAGAGEDVGESVACSLDFQTLADSGRNRDVEIIRIRRHAFHRPSLAPESPQTTRTRVPSSSATSGIALAGISW